MLFFFSVPVTIKGIGKNHTTIIRTNTGDLYNKYDQESIIKIVLKIFQV